MECGLQLSFLLLTIYAVCAYNNHEAVQHDNQFVDEQIRDERESRPVFMGLPTYNRRDSDSNPRDERSPNARPVYMGLPVYNRNIDDAAHSKVTRDEARDASPSKPVFMGVPLFSRRANQSGKPQSGGNACLGRRIFLGMPIVNQHMCATSDSDRSLRAANEEKGYIFTEDGQEKGLEIEVGDGAENDNTVRSSEAGKQIFVGLPTFRKKSDEVSRSAFAGKAVYMGFPDFGKRPDDMSRSADPGKSVFVGMPTFGTKKSSDAGKSVFMGMPDFGRRSDESSRSAEAGKSVFMGMPQLSGKKRANPVYVGVPVIGTR